MDAPSQFLPGEESLPAPFSSLHATLSMLADHIQQLQNEKSKSQLISNVAIAQLKLKFQGEMKIKDQLVKERGKLMEEAEERGNKEAEQEKERKTKEEKKWMGTLGEKEDELAGLRKQVLSLKTKIASLEVDLASANSSRQTLDHLLAKSIDALKAASRQHLSTLEDLQLEKIVLESRSKAAFQKLELMQAQMAQAESKRKMVQEAYDRMRAELKKREKDIAELKFQVQRQKMKRKDYPQKQDGNLTIKSQNNLMETILSQIGKITQLENCLNDRERILSQLAESANVSAKLVQKQQSLLSFIENQSVELDQLKIQMNPAYQESIMQERNPTLCQYFRTKKSQVQKFQLRVQQIQRYIQEKQDKIKAILTKEEEESTVDSRILKEKMQSQRERFEAELQKSNARVSMYQNSCSTLRKMVQNYKIELKEMILADQMTAASRKSLKRKTQKSRCLQCLLPFGKTQKFKACCDCSKSYHCQCFEGHQCKADSKAEMETFQSCIQ